MFPWFSQGKGDIHLLAAGVTHTGDRSEWAQPSKSEEWTSRKGGISDEWQVMSDEWLEVMAVQCIWFGRKAKALRVNADEH
jgi:hypothetical protein